MKPSTLTISITLSALWHWISLRRTSSYAFSFPWLSISLHLNGVHVLRVTPLHSLAPLKTPEHRALTSDNIKTDVAVFCLPPFLAAYPFHTSRYSSHNRADHAFAWLLRPRMSTLIRFNTPDAELQGCCIGCYVALSAPLLTLTAQPLWCSNFDIVASK